MQASMYNALFGALTQEHRLASIANNLANVNTTGYKRESLAFKDVFIRLGHNILDPVAAINEESLMPAPDRLAQVRIALSYTDFSQGRLQETGNPLDVALHGEGFFKVRTPQGDLYTRNGKFHLTPDGQLVNSQNYPVLGGGGEINIEPGGQVYIAPNGQILVNNEGVDTLQVVSFTNPQVLEKAGHNLYRVRDGLEAVEEPAENVSVLSGYLEGANVEVVQEMVSMIETHRLFEAYQRVMHTTQENDQRLIREVAAAARR
jgi:flagellar basal-body rod protein FlgG